MREETEHVHAVIEADENDAFLCQVGSVVLVFRRRSSRVSSTMDKDHDRQSVTCAACRRPNVQVQAVLTDRHVAFAPGIAFRVRRQLHTRREKWSARSTPCQAVTGCGARHRRLPMGGAAYGMPRNNRTPYVHWIVGVPVT